MYAFLLSHALAGDPDVADGDPAPEWTAPVLDDDPGVPAFEEPEPDGRPALAPDQARVVFAANALAVSEAGRVVDASGLALSTGDLLSLDPDRERAERFELLQRREYSYARACFVGGPVLVVTGVLLAKFSHPSSVFSEVDDPKLFATALALSLMGTTVFTVGLAAHHATTVYVADPIHYAAPDELQALVETHNTRLRDQLGLSGSVTFHVVVGPGSVGVEGGF